LKWPHQFIVEKQLLKCARIQHTFGKHWRGGSSTIVGDVDIGSGSSDGALSPGAGDFDPFLASDELNSGSFLRDD